MLAESHETPEKSVAADYPVPRKGGELVDMDSPCPYGIGCARLKTAGRSITEQEESE